MSNRSLTGIKAGQQLDFTSYGYVCDGFIPTVLSQPVEGVAGGGFRGEVYLLPDSVLKTGATTPIKHVLRELNGAIPRFEPAHSEPYAQLDVIAGLMLHGVVPPVTGGAVSTPKPFGYSHLPKVGYAQHIERVSGRPVRFDDGGEEDRAIARVRSEIWEIIGGEFGMEHAGQVHPKNPFGKPNLWIGDEGKIIWLDYLPAFDMKGRAWPNPFPYKHHIDAKREFGRIRPLDMVHTDRFRAALNDREESFTNGKIQELHGLADAYDQLRPRMEAARPEKPTHHLKVLQVTRSTGRAAISPFQPTNSADSEQNDTATGRRSLRDLLRPRNIQQAILEKTMLAGLRISRDKGVVDSEDYEAALQFMNPRDRSLFTRMQVGFFTTSRLADLISVPFYATAATSENPPRDLLITGLTHQLAPNIFRGGVTYSVGKAVGKDFSRFALHASMPFVGTYTSVPTQVNREYATSEHGRAIKHHNLRMLATTVSKVFPSGGYGSDMEQKVWETGRAVSVIAHNTTRQLGAAGNYFYSLR
jgi:hypothetical protein